MLGDVLRARYHWDRGDHKLAVGYLNRVLGGGEAGDAFSWTASESMHQATLPFEIAVANLLLTEGLLVHDFDVAFVRLWSSLPLQYLIVILSQWSLDRDRGVQIVDLLSRVAASGMLSVSANDYDLRGKVVLDPEAYPEIVDAVGPTLVETITRAAADGAWNRVAAPNADLVIDLFMYAVFHREPNNQPEMILARLERLAESHADFLRALSVHLDRWMAEPGVHQPLVTIGMRVEQAENATACLEQFAEALVSRQLEPFVERYYRRT
jgi:hypothetical protein